MALEEAKLRRVAKILEGLSESDIRAIIKEQSRMTSAKEVAKRDRELVKLQKSAVSLQAKLDEVNRRIAEINGGGPVGASRSRGKGNVSGRPFAELVLDVLREKGQPTRPKDIRTALYEKGWYQGSVKSANSSIGAGLRELVQANKAQKLEKGRYSAN